MGLTRRVEIGQGRTEGRPQSEKTGQDECDPQEPRSTRSPLS